MYWIDRSIAPRKHEKKKEPGPKCFECQLIGSTLPLKHF